LGKDNAKDKKKSRVLVKALRLVDPKLRNGRGQNQQRNHVIFCRFGLLTAKDEKCQAAGKHRKEDYLQKGQIFQIAHELAALPSPAPHLA